MGGAAPAADVAGPPSQAGAITNSAGRCARDLCLPSTQAVAPEVHPGDLSPKLRKKHQRLGSKPHSPGDPGAPRESLEEGGLDGQRYWFVSG